MQEHHTILDTIDNKYIKRAFAIMESSKKFIVEKEEGPFPISKEDMKRLQRAADENTSSFTARRIRRGLESAIERRRRTKRTVPSSRTPQVSIPKPEGSPSVGSSGGTEDARRSLIKQFERPSRVTPNPSGATITNMPGGNIPDEQKFDQLERIARQRQSKSAAAASDVSPEARTQAANTAARARETRPTQRVKLGDTTKGGPVKVTTLKPSKPAPAPKPEAIKQSAVSAKQAAYRKRVATQGSNLLKSIQGGRETTARMGRAYGKNLSATGDAIIQGIGAERKAETAAGNKEFKQQRYGRGRSGPATTLRTPAQTKTYQTGAQKGYFDPKTGRVSETGLQKHVNMRTVGGENFGKFKGKDPRAALQGVENIVPRAAAGDKAARSEVRRSYKSITTKYSPETGARPARQGGSKSFRSFQQQIANVDAPKLTPQRMSMPLPGTQQKPVSSPAAQATKEILRQKLNLKINAKSQRGGALGFPVQTGISAPSKPAEISKGTRGGELATGTKPGQLVAPSKPSTTASPSRQTTYTGIGGGKSVEVAGAPKKPTATTNLLPPGQPPVKPSGKPKEVKIPKPLAPKKSQLVRKVEQGLSGAKLKYPTDSTGARRLVKLRQGGRLLGRAVGPAFAAWDAYDVYKAERERGQTKERATKAAVAKAGGGALGAWAGAKAGAALGGAIGSIVPGAGTAIGAGLGGLAGGVLGYMGGEKIGSAALGASKKDKEWMKWANRKNQAGTAAADATFKSGNKAIVKDKEGKERVGYLAYKNGKPVYKYANDPKSLQYTSSNPLERLGRTFLPGMYKGKDEEARKRRVAALKASTSK